MMSIFPPDFFVLRTQLEMNRSAAEQALRERQQELIEEKQDEEVRQLRMNGSIEGECEVITGNPLALTNKNTNQINGKVR